MIFRLVAGALLLSPLVALGAAAAIGVTVIRSPWRVTPLRALGLGALAVTIWLGGTVLTVRAASPDLAARWAAVALAGAALLPPAFHRLAATFASARPTHRWLQAATWAVGVLLAAFALGGRLVSGVEMRPWGWQPVYARPAWALVGFVWVAWILSLLEIRTLAREVGPDRRRAVHRLAVAVGIAGLAAADLVPGLDAPFPPLGFFPLLAFLLLGASAFRLPQPGIREETAEKILALLADGLALLDAQGRIEIVNDALCWLTGRSRAQLVGLPLESLFRGPGDRSFVGWDWKRQPVREELATLDTSSEDEIEVEVRVSIAPLRGHLGAVEGAVVVLRDLRDERRAQLRLAETEHLWAERAEERIERLLDSVPDPLVILDTEGTLLRVNRRLEEELGFAREELLGRPVEILIPERLRDPHALRLAEHIADPVAGPMGTGLELQAQRKDGSEIPIDVGLAPIADPDGPRVIAAIRDLSERKRLESELARLTLHDVLTGLPNRALLTDRLRAAVDRTRLRDGRPFALLCIGLDRFEDITSSLGHAVGDELLVTCAERLREFALAGDTVSRLGDDVFVILQDRIGGVADATRLADRILGALARKTELAGQEVFVGASVGIALSGESEASDEAMLRDAETAMHRARRRGQRSYEVFHPEMHEQATLRLELGMDLQRAIECEQLFLEFQPIVSVPTGKVVGAEALLRWRHPKQGLIEPSDLIPLAEETGSISAIGEWVLETACRQNLSWQHAGLETIFVAVNLSAAQLRQRELPARVKSVLRDTGLDPGLLDLELTETLLMENADLALDALAALRSTGAGLCVDDFGVGHSSLSYLQRLPISALKIDRSFVLPMGKEERSDSLMAAIVGMAHSLDLKAIAEGVESADQLDSLRSLGCDEYQGFLYSPPISAEGLGEMLRTGVGG